MTTIQAIVYGIVQGLTEFIPVSSTAHLRLVPSIFGWTDPGSSFTAVIQLGTTVALLIYFWKDLASAFMGWFKSLSGDRTTLEARIGWAVFYATISIAVIALALQKYVEGPLRSLYVVGFSFIFMGILMYIADKGENKGRELDTVQPLDGLKIGLWQCLALIPGMSRSGSTITGAYFNGFGRPAAARLSFLMSVPAITLAGLYEGAKNYKHLGGGMLTPTMIATAVSFVVGYLVIGWLITFLSTKGPRPFVAYRVIVGILIISLCLMGKLNPNETPEDTNVPTQATTTR